ncbi:LON peptidase substrate-binding domain-containing protein [Actinoallomurus sp. NPDC052274]|uniref:LON peptidase substrate-binding domain-containing protein n=1 Tax=Actinoallomurus sp. NPDC052274 TaxID=3155420 RepID=UPI0034373232
MTERLPIFPLGAVLFPGLVLPLQIFEERYRDLMRDLLEGEEPFRFGVVSIELGHEVGPGAARRLAAVGCTAELRGVQRHDDGRYDVVTSGGTRFRIEDVDDSLSYLRADVTMLPEENGPGVEEIAGPVTRLFHRYCDRLIEHGAEVTELDDLPEQPVQLSYVVAASMVLDRHDKQRLLQAEDAATRLHLEYDLLRRENLLLKVFPAVPASEFLGGTVSPN